MRYFLIIFAFFGLVIASHASAATMQILTPQIRLGETLVLKFDEQPKSVSFDNQTITAFPYQNGWRAVMAMPLSAKTGTYQVKAEFSDKTVQATISVLKKIQKIIVLAPPPKLGLTAPEITQQLAVSNVSIRKTVEQVEDLTRFSQLFGLPLADNRKISSPFGEVRKTGDESITHLGTDFDAARGRAVAAINAGVVKEAYVDDIYGNSVIVDHGRGIYSLYLHLDTMKVKAGDQVKKGTLIGTVGDSGLATAPHLHLSIKINGTSVDPIQFVYSFR